VCKEDAWFIYSKSEVLHVICPHAHNNGFKKKGAKVRVGSENLNDRARTPLYLVSLPLSQGSYWLQGDGLDVAKLLLERRAAVDMNARDSKDYETLLHLTRYHGWFDIARVLLNYDPIHKNHYTPFLLAALNLNGRLEILQVLLDHGTNANTENDQCDTPLTRTAYESLLIRPH